jgi:hypothetical protein
VLFHSNIASLDASVLNEVTGEEKSLMIASCTWDVDFVSIYGDSDQILDDTELAELLGNSSGKILSLCCLQNVRTEAFGRMLMFAKAGDWTVGTSALT